MERREGKRARERGKITCLIQRAYRCAECTQILVLILRVNRFTQVERDETGKRAISHREGLISCVKRVSALWNAKCENDLIVILIAT